MRAEHARLSIARVLVACGDSPTAAQLEITRQRGTFDVTLLLGPGKNPACFAYALVVEGITARVKLGPVVAPPITLVIAEHAGARHHFTLPGSLWRARGRIAARAWEFSAANASARIHGTFAAETADFVGLHYENPDGAMTCCLNSKIAHGSLRLEVAGQAPLIARTRAAALEIGTRDTAHGVAMLA